MRLAFSDHIVLLEQFLSSRQTIAEELERRLFGARGKAAAQGGDRESIAEIFQSCFHESPAISQHFSTLNGTLDAAHRADGFEPARQDGYARGLDPSELVLRACHYWDSARWPGRSGRLVFAQSLYAMFVLHQLELLSLRIWDPSTALGAGQGSEDPAERLQHLQRLLDLLNIGGTSPHRMRLARDARWLIQTAQGPLTRHVKPYFIKAGNISRSFTDSDRLEVHKAGAVLAGGHLRSQLRHLSWRTGWAFDNPQLLALTRSSNAMDMSLLVRDLVPLLDAYTAVRVRRDEDVRLALADAILQGMSADPELLLTRLDLLGPTIAIEDVSSEIDREYVARYGELVTATVESLHQDSRAFDPTGKAYSPLGIVYGFCADLFSNMVLNTLRAARSSDLTLEDLFISRERLDEKRAQAREWERLPKRDGEPNPFEHTSEWAAQMYARLDEALAARAARPAEPNASKHPMSRLYVMPRGVSIDSPSHTALPPGVVSAQ